MNTTTMAMAQRTFRDHPALAEYGSGAVCTVKAIAERIGGNEHAHFSVTCSVTTPESCTGGCMRELCVALWPEIAPAVALHLADAENGMPMHAVENGWYWLSGFHRTSDRYRGDNGTPARTPEECLALFAEHVRLPLEEARAVASRCTSKALWTGECVDMRERWMREAEEGVALLHRLSAS